MADQDPQLHLSYDGENVDFNRRTAGLFKFLGDWATHDHIFIIQEPETEEDTSTGFYVFKENPSYMKLARFMIDNKFIIHINLPEPNDMDKAAFSIAFCGDLDSGPPAEWGPNAS